VLQGCRDEAKATSESPNLTAAASPPAALAPEASGPSVVFLGDSITAGLHLPAEQAFPALLAQKLADSGAPFRLLNAGVSGDTSAGGLRRVDWLLRQKPDLVVVELGANDGLRGISVPTIEANLRAILEKIRQSGARVLLLGMRIPLNYGAEYTAAFEGMYPKLARELEVPFVPYFMDGVAGVPTLNLEDGLHPTAEGHLKLALNVEGALRSVLTRTP
jgi:acyl-CoA thioesterase-1